MNSFQLILFGLAYLSQESNGAATMVPCFQGVSINHPTLNNAIFYADTQGNWQSKCSKHEIKLSGDYWVIIQEGDMLIGVCEDEGIKDALSCSKWQMFSSSSGDTPQFKHGVFHSPSDDECHCNNELKQITDEDIELARQKACDAIGCPLDKCEITGQSAVPGTVTVSVGCNGNEHTFSSSLCLSGQDQFFNGHLNEQYQYGGMDANNYPYYHSNCNNLFISRIDWDDRFWIGREIGNSYGYAKCSSKGITDPKDCPKWEVVGRSGDFELSSTVTLKYNAACQSQC